MNEDDDFGVEDIEEPCLTDELSYAHRPKESTPTRKSLSPAARELTTEVAQM